MWERHLKMATLMTLKMKKETMNQGMQAASQDRKDRERDFPLEPPGWTESNWHLACSPMSLFLLLKMFIWLHWVLLVAHGIFHCGMWAYSCPHGTWDLSSLTRNWPCVPCIGRWILNHWTTREVPRESSEHHSFKIINLCWLKLISLWWFVIAAAGN